MQIKQGQAFCELEMQTEFTLLTERKLRWHRFGGRRT
jgi:hypothetical protein